MSQPIRTADDERAPRRPRHALAISGVVFVVLLLVIAATVLLSLRRSLHPAHQPAAVTHTHAGIRHLSIDAHSTNVSLVAAAAGSSSVAVTRKLAWSGEAPSVEETTSNDTLTVTTHCGKTEHLGFPSCRADLTVRVPADLPVTVHTDSGDTRVRDLTGSVTIQESSGDVSLVGVSGPVDARIDSGDLNSSGLRSGSVKANGNSGNVRLSFAVAPSDVDASTSSGDVTVVVPRAAGGYAVATSKSADDTHVVVDNRSGSARKIDARADSGSVTVTYPS